MIHVSGIGQGDGGQGDGGYTGDGQWVCGMRMYPGRGLSNPLNWPTESFVNVTAAEPNLH